MKSTFLLTLLALLACVGCSDEGDDLAEGADEVPDAGMEVGVADGGGEDVPEPEPEPEAVLPHEMVLTADWLNESLTVFDYGALVGGAWVEEARLRTIDLSGRPPGPIEVELTPDGRIAVVAAGAGLL